VGAVGWIWAACSSDHTQTWRCRGGGSRSSHSGGVGVGGRERVIRPQQRRGVRAPQLPLAAPSAAQGRRPEDVRAVREVRGGEGQRGGDAAGAAPKGDALVVHFARGVLLCSGPESRGDGV
jgi:hypothetical protein